ncbi:MAG: hypothetical protein P4N60_16585 [Verrucomicrobiae bacterium]|nr:hypothetical protein [Verrucomicrobiae bacterium]
MRQDSLPTTGVKGNEGFEMAGDGGADLHGIERAQLFPARAIISHQPGRPASQVIGIQIRQVKLLPVSEVFLNQFPQLFRTFGMADPECPGQFRPMQKGERQARRARSDAPYHRGDYRAVLLKSFFRLL